MLFSSAGEDFDYGEDEKFSWTVMLRTDGLSSYSSRSTHQEGYGYHRFLGRIILRHQNSLDEGS